MSHVSAQNASLVGQFGGDVGRGLLSTAKLLTVLVGGFTSIVAVALLANPGLRDNALKVMPTPILSWVSDHLKVRKAFEEQRAAAVADQSEKGGAQTVRFDPEEQKRVTQYLSRRYRVAEDAMRALVAVAYESAHEVGVDPLLVLSVMAVESSMNPFAESPVGAQGLMQVMTRVHTEKFEPLGGEHAALDPVANIKVGTIILEDVIRRGGSIERGLQLYVGAGNMSHDGGYGKRVLGEHARIKLAARGKVKFALMTGLREDARSKSRPAEDEAVRLPIQNVAPARIIELNSDSPVLGVGNAT